MGHISHETVYNLISIHTPREGSDLVGVAQQVVGYGFQSTLPVRGVTAKITRNPPGNFCITYNMLIVLHNAVKNASINLIFGGI